METDTTIIADTISWPADKWKGNCYAVATAIHKAGLIDGKVEYGFWLGPIAEGSHFENRPLTRHGWVRLPDKTIYDPTRWVFENVAPYIYVGEDDHYDPAMRSFRRRDRGIESFAVEFIDAYRDGWRDFEIDDLYRLAHGFPEDFDFLVAEVYDALDALGHKALIPIDFWNEVMK